MTIATAARQQILSNLKIDSYSQLRIVSHQRGSWRLQDACCVAAYAPHLTRDGRLVWEHSGYRTRKLSYPQVYRSSYADLDHGSARGEPVIPQLLPEAWAL